MAEEPYRLPQGQALTAAVELCFQEIRDVGQHILRVPFMLGEKGLEIAFSPRLVEHMGLDVVTGQGKLFLGRVGLHLVAKGDRG